MVIATWITKQLVFNGAVSGLAIGLLAMGIVLVYRATRVINFAVGSTARTSCSQDCPSGDGRPHRRFRAGSSRCSPLRWSSCTIRKS